VEEEGFKLKIRRGANGNPVATSNGGPIVATLDPVGNPLLVGTNPSLPTGTDKEEPGVAYIKAPMVGTFYRSPSPESPAFVEVNAKVEENSVICIIEAMKIMNEIQAEAKARYWRFSWKTASPLNTANACSRSSRLDRGSCPRPILRLQADILSSMTAE